MRPDHRHRVHGSCLALGLGLFLAGEAAREWSRIRLAATADASRRRDRRRRVAGVGAYGALLSVPL
jgi:hypothetical protein